jgi:hypothetical protein
MHGAQTTVLDARVIRALVIPVPVSRCSIAMWCDARARETTTEVETQNEKPPGTGVKCYT